MATKSISSKEEFKTEVIESEKPVILDFWAPWCGPCKMLTPNFEALSDEMNEVSFIKINIDEAEDIVQEFQIMAVPTIVLIKGGKVLNDRSGAMTKDQLRDFINSSLQDA